MRKERNKKLYIKLKFDDGVKMPVSLNPYEPEEPSRPNTTGVIRRRLKTTIKMVDDALIELHTAKGTTLRKIYSFILAKYNLDTLTKIRVNLVKKHLITLRESQDLISVTGKGLSGHFKLADKNKFKKRIEVSKETLNATQNLNRQFKISGKEKTSKVKAKNKSEQNILKKKSRKRIIEKPNININAEQIAPVIPRQITPPPLHNYNASMFDTPMVASQVHASTPFVTTASVPRAPEVRKRFNRKRLIEEGTPRSSFPGKKRRLHKR